MEQFLKLKEEFNKSHNIYFSSKIKLILNLYKILIFLFNNILNNTFIYLKSKRRAKQMDNSIKNNNYYYL